MVVTHVEKIIHNLLCVTAVYQGRSPPKIICLAVECQLSVGNCSFCFSFMWTGNKCTQTFWSLPGTDIVIQRLTFVKLVGTLLQTLTFNFTVVGGPTLVPGPLGGLALLLNGVDQYMDLTQQPTDGCLWDLDQCDLGLTVSFRLKVTEVRLNMFKHQQFWGEIQHLFWLSAELQLCVCLDFNTITGWW